MRNLFVILFSLITLIAYSVEEEVVLEVGSGVYGTLRIPDSELPIPVALIIAGSGPTDRDGNNMGMKNNSLKMLAEGLNEMNVATLNYDKRGIAASQMKDQKEEDMRFEDYVDDAKSWIQFLSEDTRFSSVLVIGHSEGSLIGMLASEGNPQVKAFVSLAGIAESADIILKKQLGEQSAELLEWTSPMIDQLKKGEMIDDVPEMLYSLFRPSVQPYMISWFKYNPVDVFKKLTIPSLVIGGTTDIQVETHQVDLLVAANPMAIPFIIDNMNHVLKETDITDRIKQIPVYMNPDLPLHPGLLPAIHQFLIDKKLLLEK